MLTKMAHCDGSFLGWSKYTHSLRDRDRVMWLMSPAWALKASGEGLEACGGFISLNGFLEEAAAQTGRVYQGHSQD